MNCSKIWFLCMCIVYWTNDRVQSLSIGNMEEKSTKPEQKHSIQTESMLVTAKTEFTTTVYEDPTMSSAMATSLEGEIGETTSTGNSTSESISLGIRNSSEFNFTYEVTTISDSQAIDKQTMTTVTMSTILDGSSKTSSYPDQRITPDPDNKTSFDFTHTVSTSKSGVKTKDTNKETVFSGKLVYCLIGIVSLLGTIFLILIIKKISSCIKKSRRGRPKRKHSWKRARATISDTYFTIMSGKRPPLPPRNPKKILTNDVEQPYHIQVPMDNHAHLVYQNSEESSNQIPSETHVPVTIDDSTIISVVENVYETAFHNNGFARDEDEPDIIPKMTEDSFSVNGPNTDEDSRALKRYISMRCRPNGDGETPRNSAYSDNSSKSEINGDQVIDDYINHLLKSSGDIGPLSPEYNSYDSLPHHASLQSNFNFPSSEHSDYILTDKEKSFFGNDAYRDLQSPDYNSLEFREFSDDSRKNTDCLTKKEQTINNRLNSDTSGKYTDNSSNEHENEYTLDPTQSIAENTELQKEVSGVGEKILLQRGMSWQV